MTFKTFVVAIIQFLNTSVIPLLLSLAFLVVLWGIAQYFFLKREDPKARTEGMQFMVWGLVGLAVIVSMWGLVGVLLSSFGLS